MVWFDEKQNSILKLKENIKENGIRDACTPQPREIFSPWDIEVLYQYKVQDTFRDLSVM